MDIFEKFSSVVFAAAAIILMILAAALMVDAVIQFGAALWTGRGFGMSSLTGIGYIVVAVAVFDVAKYLIEEEVVRNREMRVASEARRSLTRFISTIAIAIFLEALVTVFRVSHENVTHLIYPTLLLLSAILLVLGLGVYQWLSSLVEPRVEQRDRAQAAKSNK